MYSFALVGVWLAIAAGFAAMYLRGHLVYDILHSKDEKLKQTTIEPPPIENTESDLSHDKK